MKLSELVYNVVKSTFDFGESAFTYDSFKEGLFDDSVDYGAQKINSFTEINLAIHRLSDLRKIPFKVEKFSTSVDSSIMDFSSLGFKVKKVIAIVKLDERSGDYYNFGFRNIGAKKVNIIGLNTTKPQQLYVEYIEEIPNFKESDFDYSEGNNKDVDLEDYGIDENMCSMIILYASARLLYLADPQLSYREEYLGEQYFDQLESHGSSFLQKRVQPISRIGW